LQFICCLIRSVGLSYLSVGWGNGTGISRKNLFAFAPASTRDKKQRGEMKMTVLVDKDGEPFPICEFCGESEGDGMHDWSQPGEEPEFFVCLNSGQAWRTPFPKAASANDEAGEGK
jgi:hypothetical protein